MTSRKITFAVFAYLPDQVDGVPAGLLDLFEKDDELLQSDFRYGRRYVQRKHALALDPFTLALPGGGDVNREPMASNRREFGVFRDAAPDRWGRRVIENKLRKAGPLPESEYLRHAGSNRMGALDFRANIDASESVGLLPQIMDLAYLQEAAERIDAGEAVPSQLSQIFDAGVSMGGARPKAVVEVNQRQWIAKFAMPGDPFVVPDIEFATLELARAAGLDVPALQRHHLGKERPVMLIERFDRERQGERYTRRHFMSGLSMLCRHESESPLCSYAQLSEAIARHGVAAHIRQDQRELFGRMVFNILVNNNDDHLRNHGFMLDPFGRGYRLAPLYDVVPCPGLAHERFLHLGVGLEGRLATLVNAMSRHAVFGLTQRDALEDIVRISSIVREWRVYFEAAGVSARDMARVASAFRHPRDLGLEKLSFRVA